MPKILIPFYSRSGTVEALAQAVAEGARPEGAEVRLRRVREFVSPEAMAQAPGWKEQADAMNARHEAPTADDAVWADAIIFGSPTYMGGPSWQFKKFADASAKPWFAAKWQDKVFGGFTNSASMNGDKLNTLEYFVLLAGQRGGLWVSLAIKPANVKASKRDDLNRMGSYIAPMAQSDADASPSDM